MTPDGKIRYAVVGLGHIAQVAVLPGFKHAQENSVLAALVSDDSEKRKQLKKKYRAARAYSHDEFDLCLRSGEIDAVYLAVPNDRHCECAVRAAAAGVHVLCEKPMAVTEAECERMIRAADEHDVKLMIAYRLHFEEANLETLKIARSGKIGDLRAFNSTFTMSVEAPNIRLHVQVA